ncbi:hypothetical protein NEOLEDRAFT_1128368 [Neolentinus lepideus HHB14362 ss-1]|uniref:Uncharacterized protein n=1 Tax=Neolentinus lepideus HHB14362 ss-1 TaxID=1314782 RepID=A0A165VEW6_9AGAM|nr:hypothetical protein NEOLEDRAFT_1128368 [Neolentinus lepideus HHB14362 ss-1]
MDSPSTAVIPLAIRFVPYDQWLVTHISTTWKTKQVKQYILSKCLPFSTYVRSQAPEPPQPRSLSPITFASVSASRSRRSLDQRSITSASAKGDDDGEDEVDEDEDGSDDIFPVDQNKYIRPNRDHYHNTAFANDRPSPDNAPPSTKSARQSRSESRLCHHSHFSLLTYSTFHLLEDDYTISWYRLRPYELLEMHLAGAIIRLQRDSLLKYVEPYFECKVKALRVVHKEARPDVDRERENDRGKTKEKESDLTGSQTSSSSSSRLRSTHSHPSAPLPLRKSKIEWRERWIVIRHGILRLCKDRNTASSSQAFPLSALRTIRGSEHLQNAANTVPSRGKGETIVCAKFKQASSSHGYASHSYSSSSFTGGSPGASGTGLYTDEYGRRGSASKIGSMSEGITEEREHERRAGKEDVWIILDMLDEYAYSSLLRILHRRAPSSLSSSVLPPQPDSDSAVPFPEWRLDLVDRARKVGMGDLGPVLEWALLGEETKKKDWRRSGSWNVEDNEEEEEAESEKEWEHWTGDLERQRKFKAEKELFDSEAPSTPPQSIRHPNPPPMRVFSPPPTSFASGSHSGMGGPFTESSVARMANRRTTTTTSTVSVGGRVRSTTVSVATAAKPPSTATSKGPALKLSLFGGHSGRDGETVRYDFAPNDDRDVPAGLRHATSLENVRGSESGWDGRVLHSAVEAGHRNGGRKKGGLGLARGISVRAGAEKLVKRLDSALDFVEGK